METLSTSKKLGHKLKKTGYRIATAESCTGGLLASAITDVSGCSEYFDLGVVVYSPEQKTQELGVLKSTLGMFTPVSKEVCREMMNGLYEKTQSDICVAVTGYAGPAGGTNEDPVGTVYVGIKADEYNKVFRCSFDGDRLEIKSKTVDFILNKILSVVASMEYM